MYKTFKILKYNFLKQLHYFFYLKHHFNSRKLECRPLLLADQSRQAQCVSGRAVNLPVKN